VPVLIGGGRWVRFRVSALDDISIGKGDLMPREVEVASVEFDFFAGVQARKNRHLFTIAQAQGHRPVLEGIASAN
jgi:hypothetical protein